MNTVEPPQTATSVPIGAWMPASGNPCDVDELMHRIGMGLQEPLRAAAMSLERARRSDTGGDRAALYDHVAELLRVVDALAELVQAWGCGCDAAGSPVALWPLLQDVWAEVEPLAALREVGIRVSLDVPSPEMAHVVGNPRWLRRVLVECLWDSVAATPRGEQLDVLLQQRDRQLCLVLRDGDRGKAGAASAPAMLLDLCRHVLHQHGGALHETVEGGQRQRVLEMPVGLLESGVSKTPACAQRYASDLAALGGSTRPLDPVW